MYPPRAFTLVRRLLKFVSSAEQVVEEQEEETARGMEDGPLKVEVHSSD